MARLSAKQSREKVRVDLRVRLAPDVEVGDGIFVTGNLPALGDWKPAAIQLRPLGRRSFAHSFEVLAGTPVEFKVTRGTWRSQAIYLDPDGRFPPDNRVVCPEDDVRLDVTVIDWLDRIAVEVDPVVGDLRTHDPLPTGDPDEPPRTWDESREPGGEPFVAPLSLTDVVAVRTLQVWLPPSYETSRRSYPVLYMHDGQNLFDPAGSFAGQDWKVDETVSRLIGERRLRELIVVSIPNSPDRMLEYNLDRPLGKAYARFLIEGVKPFIDATYRTLPDPPHTGVMGSSMGGLISFQLAWAHPEIFGLAGCLSSAFYKSWRGVTRLVREHPEAGRRLRIYLDTGELEPPIVSSFRRMESILRKIGLRPDLDFLAHFAPGATHSERAWGDRLAVPLEFLFGPPSPSRKNR